MSLDMLIHDERYEVKIEFAINSLPFLDDETISKVTNLSLEEVQKLRKEHESK